MASDAVPGPLVSIVTPVLNRAESIRSCLASVRSQSYRRIEHIVIDGGSTDGTLDVIAEFQEAGADRDFKWISEPDQGMYDAINKGLEMARGEIIAYLNSDDFYLPWSVAVAVDLLRDGKDLIFGDLGVLQRLHGNRNFRVQFYRSFDLSHYTHAATIGQPTVFWRRQLMDEIGEFDTSYRLIGDCEYWLRAATSGASLTHVKEVLAVQVEHEETLRSLHPSILKEEFMRIRQHYSRYSLPLEGERVRALKRTLFWRRRQLQFRKAVRARRADGWPHFIRFLKGSGIEIDTFGFLLIMLPERMRPSRSLWGDMAKFEAALSREVGLSVS